MSFLPCICFCYFFVKNLDVRKKVCKFANELTGDVVVRVERVADYRDIAATGSVGGVAAIGEFRETKKREPFFD